MFRRLHCCFSLLLLLSGALLHAQEICDNGFDDDGNGLTDLNDPSCICQGIFIGEDATDHLPNPSFEDFYCCPTWYANMGCALGWIQGTDGTSDFHHECGWVGEPVQYAGLTPFPDGAGVAGTIFSSGWKEYIAGCLYETLEAGVTYTLKFHIASTPITAGGAICNDGDVYYPAVDIAIFGNPTCAKMPLTTYDCPSAVEPSWTVIGSATYVPAVQWSEMEITFTPPTDIRAVMIGPPCSLPPGYTGGAPCFPYFLFDGLTLEKQTPVPDISISVQGHPCMDNLTLSAIGGATGATWQWFFDGVALSGETGVQLSLPESQYQNGTYSLLLLLGEQCLRADVTLDFPLPDPTVEEVFFCPGGQVACAGQTFSEPGVYDVALPSFQGCDSLVTCLVQRFPSGPPDTLRVVACTPPYVTAFGDTLVVSGLYSRSYTDRFGCDSTVHLDLRFLEPEIGISATGMLGCDSASVVNLTSLSDSILQGTPSLYWQGPTGGIKGSVQDSSVLAILPGTYCLELTLALDGISCRDTACLDLFMQDSLPLPPVLQVPHSVCPGQEFTVLAFPGSGSDSLVWMSSGGLNVNIQADSVFSLQALIPGKHTFCVSGVNDCGVSDSVCMELLVSAPHPPTMVQLTTCDQTQAGIDSLWLADQAGCDSLVIRTITFTGVYSEMKEVIVCGAGTDQLDTLLVTSGPCDSLFITQYRHVLPDTTRIDLTTCDPQLQGVSATILSNLWGCDSLVIVATTYVGTDTQFVQVQTCDPSQAGLQIQVLPGFLCDSVVVTETLWVPAIIERDTLTDCSLIGSGMDTLVYQASSGCDSLVITLRQGGGFEAAVTLTDESCAGVADGVIEVTVPQGGAEPLRYRLGQGLWQTGHVFVGLKPGSYVVEVESASGCRDTLAGLVIGAGSALSVDAGPDRTAEIGDLLTFVAVTSPSAVSWQWSATDPVNCPACPQMVLGPLSAVQDVVLRAFTAAGCEGTDVVRIELRARPGDTSSVYVPNGFSPNGDGINDLFIPYGSDPEIVIRFMDIYDRWGNALFHGTDLFWSDPTAGWDGSFRQNPMDPGVYVYVIEVEWPDGHKRLYKGDLTLVR